MAVLHSACLHLFLDTVPLTAPFYQNIWIEAISIQCFRVDAGYFYQKFGFITDHSSLEDE